MTEQRTLSIIKPDAVEAHKIGAIIARLEEEGFQIVAMKRLHLTRAQAEGFYAEHRGRGFFDELCAFMSRGPIVVMALQRDDAIAKYREVIGATDPKKAAAGTIRALYGANVGENAVHGSDKPETAAREIGYFFGGYEGLIRPDAIGELKDGAAGLVALSELLASRRVGPKGVAISLASVIEACAAVEAAAEVLARDVLAVTREHPEAAGEIRSLYDRAVSSVRALATEAASAARSPVDARTRLVLERAAHDACVRIAAGLFVGEIFAAAAAPRPVTVRVADVLSFGPTLPEGPSVLRATLDVPAEPVTTTDARLLRSLVEMSVQIVASPDAGRPHVEARAGRPGGAHIRVTAPPRSAPSVPPASVRPGSPAPPVLTVRRLPWPAGGSTLVRAAASMAGASASIDAPSRTVTLELP